MKKAILVTGSNGEIGSELLASMQNNPITKIAIDINEATTDEDMEVQLAAKMYQYRLHHLQM